MDQVKLAGEGVTRERKRVSDGVSPRVACPPGPRHQAAGRHRIRVGKNRYGVAPRHEALGEEIYNAFNSAIEPWRYRQLWVGGQRDTHGLASIRSETGIMSPSRRRRRAWSAPPSEFAA